MAGLVFRPLSPITSDCSRIPLGCELLDECLGGGISRSGITEVCGVAGAGKTQLVLRTLLTIQLNSSQTIKESATTHSPIRALYISTEGEAPTERLREIAEHVAHEHVTVEMDADMLLDNVFVEQAETADDLWELLHQRVPVLVRAYGVRLVVIDSIAAVFRADFRNNRTELSERKDWFFGLASAMKRLNYESGVAFIVVNQVSAGGQGQLKAALGPSWSNCINTRIILEQRTAGASNFCTTQDRNSARAHGVGSNASAKRVKLLKPKECLLRVLFSPVHVPVAVSYVVMPRGVTALAMYNATADTGTTSATCAIPIGIAVNATVGTGATAATEPLKCDTTCTPNQSLQTPARTQARLPYVATVTAATTDNLDTVTMTSAVTVQYHDSTPNHQTSHTQSHMSAQAVDAGVDCRNGVTVAPYRDSVQHANQQTRIHVCDVASANDTDVPNDQAATPTSLKRQAEIEQLDIQDGAERALISSSIMERHHANNNSSPIENNTHIFKDGTNNSTRTDTAHTNFRQSDKENVAFAGSGN